MSTIVTLSNLGRNKSAKIATKMFTTRASSLEKKINAYRRNRKWLVSHQENLRKRYGGRYVAVYNRRILRSDASHSKVLSYVKSNYHSNPAVVIDYIGKQKLKFLL